MIRVRDSKRPGSRWPFVLSLASEIGLAAAAHAQTPLYVPDVPPRAALISISTPSEAGDVTVSGAPGAVPGGSAVALFTLETGHVAVGVAATDGSFRRRSSRPPAPVWERRRRA